MIEKCRRIADYGRTETRYLHSELGMNFRLTDLQAAIGLVQLDSLDSVLSRREQIAQRYSKELGWLLRPQSRPAYVSRHANWSYLGLTSDFQRRESLLKQLNEAGIDAREPWRPIHLQPCFDLKGDYPNATEIWERGLMLPLYNDISDDQVDWVIKTANS